MKVARLCQIDSVADVRREWQEKRSLVAVQTIVKHSGVETTESYDLESVLFFFLFATNIDEKFVLFLYYFILSETKLFHLLLDCATLFSKSYQITLV